MQTKDLNSKGKSNKPSCPKDGCSNEAQEHNTYGILPCIMCQEKDRQGVGLNDLPEFATQRQTNRIQEQRDKHQQDFIPPFIGKDQKPNPDFAKQYPERAGDYFSKKQLESL